MARTWRSTRPCWPGKDYLVINMRTAVGARSTTTTWLARPHSWRRWSWRSSCAARAMAKRASVSASTCTHTPKTRSPLCGEASCNGVSSTLWPHGSMTRRYAMRSRKKTPFAPTRSSIKRWVGYGQVALLWLGQSGFALRFKDVSVVVDPFLSHHPDRLTLPAFNPGDADWIDVVACTHEHLDHLDLDAVSTLTAASSRAVVVVPQPIVDMITHIGIDPRRVIGIQPGRPVKIQSLVIHAVPASHGLKPQDAYNFGESISNGLIRYVGYVLQSPGISLY